MKAPSPEECPADQLPKFISDVINDYDNEKTVVQTAQDFQLTLSSLKQVKIIIIIYYNYNYNHFISMYQEK